MTIDHRTHELTEIRRGSAVVESTNANRQSPGGQRRAIVYAADGTFWTHAFVSIYSLLTNNQDAPLDIYLLAESAPPDLKDLAPFLRRSHPDVTISWTCVESRLLEQAPASRYFAKANYYRILVGSLLPERVERIVYLDSDTIVRRPIGDLLRLDLEDKVIAAVPDFGPSTSGTTHQSRLGLPPNAPYFNSGVLAIDLRRWRAARVEQQCSEYIIANLSNPTRLEWVDQDVLNVVLARAWLDLGPDFNYVEWTLDPRRAETFDLDRQIGGRIPDAGPAIVHYAGWQKPWTGGCRHAYAGDYWCYRQRTPLRSRWQRARVSAIDARIRLKQMVVSGVQRAPGGRSAIQRARAFTRRGRARVEGD